MYNCECLIHPFQNDPGTSQSQRAMEELLSGAAKIDARTLADLLDYFIQLSRHINYYDSQLNVSDWQLFFKNSTPFTLASVIKYQPDQLQNDLSYFNVVFSKKPSATGLQLQAYFIFYHFISKINNWYLSVKDSGLPVEKSLEVIIKDKLRQPVKDFIRYTNAAVKWYGIKRIDFSGLYDNKAWNLDLIDLYTIDDSFKSSTPSPFKQINNLYQNFSLSLPVFFSAIKIISSDAEKSLGQSLLPLKEELQKNHPPHLGLLFVFLNLFRHLQDDLNGYTKKHLDFFYKDVLQIKSREAIADKAFVVFEIQKQLYSYLIKKGILVKDGKDTKKEQILFSLDEDIVVTKTQVTDIRTLFLNNQVIPNPAKNGTNSTLLEGVYMAPDATKADGIDEDFQTDVGNFYTLGNKESKYISPGTNIYKPYPKARLGFILASPVLLLNEGTRTVTITLDCSLDEKICEELSALTFPAAKNCCDENTSVDNKPPVIEYPLFFPLTELYSSVVDALKTAYYYVSEAIISEGIKQGLDPKTAVILKKFLISSNENTEPKTYCYCPTETNRFDAVIPAADFESQVSFDSEIVSKLFKKQKPLRLYFSGEKEWIEPDDASSSFEILPNIFANQFSLIIKTSISADKPSITFYDQEKLKEDFDTNFPLVKVEMDDHFKMSLKYRNPENDCCLNKDLTFENNKIPVSLYHFFRNVKIEKDSKIDIQVCGLKNFIVQNDESVQDVNGPVYPFGTRPDLIDFDVNHTVANVATIPGYPSPLPSPLPNLIGPNFYIGSREIFYKNWDKLCVNLNWKDKPVNFNDFYTAYVKREIPDPNNPGNTITILGLNEADFQINFSLLESGKWLPEKNTTGKGFTNTITGDYNRKLFAKEPCGTGCFQLNQYDYSFNIEGKDFPGTRKFLDINFDVKKFEPTVHNGFIRLNLQNQDFLHKDYAYVLARQMMAIGKFPDKGVEGAIYLGTGNSVIVFKDTGSIILAIKTEIENAVIKAGATKAEADNIITQLGIVRDPMSPSGLNITNAEFLSKLNLPVNNTSNLAGDTKGIVDGIILKVNLLQTLLSIFQPNGQLKDDLSVPIPNEPWTPIISNMSLDYTATATSTDIDFIHLYPFAGTYKREEIQLQPSLFPTFCDEGTLFLGLKDLVPGDNLNLLFQLAEATSDSESEKEDVYWFYLDNNIWKPLRKGFEVLEDSTESLTASGIVKFALPENMTKDNTVMPKSLHWIKAAIAKNSKAVGETTGIHSQAIEVSFTNSAANDKLRLSEPLAAQSISKLNVADANVKSVQQPYETFGGRLPEMEGQFYVRVSEQLRHKGRAIQKFDYERLALEAFPQLFKAKCINHSFALNAHIYKNDFPYAPGYVILAVIPDLNKLKAGNSFEPKVPVSIIEKIDAYIRKRTSPFVRFRSMNPRYEPMNICLRVKLLAGKDENYYKEKLKQDLRELLAPWAVGQYDKLTFGQCVYRSDIIRFLETRDYVDFISDFKMGKEAETPGNKSKVCPDTPRSILIAGNIDVCIEPPECEKWMICRDENNNETKDCCATELVPIVQYCKEQIIV